jgi:hypothetical protein
MSTRTTTATATRGGGTVTVLLFLVIAAAVATVVAPVLMTQHQQAVNRQAAKEWISTHGPDCKYDCPDNRVRYMCERPDGSYAFSVIDLTKGVLSVGLTTDTGFINRMKAYCGGGAQ